MLASATERGVARPSAPPNLHVLGERPYSRLPAYLAAMDVLLIPFRLMKLTHAVNPIKLYEYCASGKPTGLSPGPTPGINAWPASSPSYGLAEPG